MLGEIKLLSDGTPIYVQIRQQILACIGSGRLVPGEQLPTMRAVAVALSVNLGTVQQAFAELERDGAVVTQRGRGTFVSTNPPRCGEAEMEAMIDAAAHQALALAASKGLQKRRFARRVAEIAEAEQAEATIHSS